MSRHWGLLGSTAPNEAEMVVAEPQDAGGKGRFSGIAANILSFSNPSYSARQPRHWANSMIAAAASNAVRHGYSDAFKDPTSGIRSSLRASLPGFLPCSLSARVRTLRPMLSAVAVKLENESLDRRAVPVD